MSTQIKILHQQAQKALNQSLYQQAHQNLMLILQQDKYFSDAYFLLAMIASAHHNLTKAIELIKQADKAMYQAKRSGKNRVHCLKAMA